MAIIQSRKAPQLNSLQLDICCSIILQQANTYPLLLLLELPMQPCMLDTGNFVLANQNSINLWESFHQPTDTILPTQILNQSSTLLARHTPTDYSKGRFLFTLNVNGNVAFYTTNFPLDSTNYAYWSTQTLGTDFQVIFNQSGSIYLTNNNGTITDILPTTTLSLQDFYQRATLDYDGVFRHYYYQKRNDPSVGTGHRAWSTSSFIPSDICVAIAEMTGGGACGFNSLCQLDDQGKSCQCPEGYILTDPNDVLKGCKQNFTSQSCDEAYPETDLFELKEMQYTDWPSGDYEHFQVDEDWCKQSCLADCFCAIAIFSESNGDCWKKGIPLSNGRIDTNVIWKSLVKIRIDNATSIPGVPHPKRKDNSTLALFGSVFILITSYFIVSIITYLVVSRIYSWKAKVSILYPLIQGINLKSFTYMELKEATNGFKEERGRGAFATVFKGVLASDNGKCVAVKRLDAMVSESDLEFKAEVSAIGRTNHRNLVQLLGFCNEGQHRILVYEFMSNGSLASFLFAESRPNWYRRREIALGTAGGLLYLHEECSSQIIHCDIKPHNILLDDSFTARIADFGVAKLLKMDQTRTSTAIRGTKGYVAPEWFKSLPVTVKVDVYSYGILLLEIICCRKSFICYWRVIMRQWMTSRFETMEKYVRIALWCIQQDPSLRPTMKDVTQMLQGTVQVSIPPNPSSL